MAIIKKKIVQTKGSDPLQTMAIIIYVVNIIRRDSDTAISEKKPPSRASTSPI